jgi:membrane protease YdiL (CAAX protease family)
MMKIKPGDQFSGVLPQTAKGRIVQFPLIRLLIAALIMVPVLALDKVFKLTVLSSFSGNILIILKYIEAIIFFVLFVTAYRLYVKLVERRTALELSFSSWLSEFGTGFLISIGLVIVIVAILYFLGYLNFVGLAANKHVALDLAVKFAMGAFIEELFFRLIIFKLSEELLGTWIALLIQAVFFGFAHQANENATVLTSISLIIVGGVFYTAAFMYTRRIWFPFGIHMAWNYFQSGIFSMPNSGTSYDGLIATKVSGPIAITGGNFGIEASYVAIFLCSIIGIWLVVISYKAGQFTHPLWKRRIG